MFLYPYKTGSQSAKDLANALGIKRIKTENSNFKGSPEKVVINWGSSNLSNEVMKCKVVNHPEAVARATDKLRFFRALDGTGLIPLFTTSKDVASQWILNGGEVVCRTILNGHSGAGIVMATEVEELVDAPLYVQYVPKKQEYRVHVFKGQVKDVQRKARNREIPDDKVNWKIRNHGNGFIFSRNEALGDVPVDVLDIAVEVVRALGLDFGAVDIVYNESQARAYALEVNTAPGLAGETLNIYKELFTNMDV